MKRAPLVLSIASLLAAAPALAQTNPTFTFAKPDAPKPAEVAKTGTPPPPPPPAVEWKAMAKAGFTMTSGNSQTTGFVGAGSVSRKEGSNKLAFDANAAYARSNVVASVVGTDPTTGMPAVTSITRNDQVTTNNWLLKGRYDRFFTLNNSGYVAAQAAADKVAGKSFYGGGQIGYSRQLYTNAMQTLVGEVGYDLSYERYVQVPMVTHDPVTIHSARLFVGETVKLSPATGVTASVEALFNLNKEGSALVYTSTPAIPPATGVDAFKDTRVNGKIGLTTTLYKKLSIAFGFTLKYDENPAPLPIPPGTMSGLGFETGFTPFADKVDTLTEATLIYTFL